MKSEKHSKPAKVITRLALLEDLMHISGTAPALSASGVNRILVVKTDALGDAALFLPFFAGIMEYFPREFNRITLLAQRPALELAKLFPQLRDVRTIELDTGRFMQDADYRHGRLKLLRQDKYDALWQWRYFHEPLLEGLIARQVNPGTLYRFTATPRHPNPVLRKIAGFPRLRELTVPFRAHEWEKNAAFAQFLTGGNEVKPVFPALPAPAEPGNYAVILPGGGKGSFFRWPAENFIARAKTLEEPVILVCGTEEERPLLEEVAAGIGERAMVRCNLSMAEYASLLTHAALLLANDTGGVHIAAWNAVPALVAAPPLQPGWFLPYPANHPASCRIRHFAAKCRCRGCSGNCYSTGNVAPCLKQLAPETLTFE